MMKTVQIQIDPEQALLDTAQLDRLLKPAADCLRHGGLVAFPTETVYGLGAHALDKTAVAAIFAAKGRPGDNPLIVHVASPDAIRPLTSEMPPLAIALLEKFAPGPLTLILPRSSLVPDEVTAGLDTVAVRIPAHPIARRLIELAGVPVAAPSANRSGKPSPTRAWHVAEDLAGVIPFIIDGGACEYGLESTVLDLTGPAPLILRPGAVSAEAIAAAVADFSAGAPAQTGLLTPPPATSTSAPKSPGMKYRHYAPAAELLICDQPTPAERAAAIAALLAVRQNQAHHNTLLKIGLYLSAETYALLRQVPGLQLPDQAESSWLELHLYAEHAEPAAASHHLFDALRTLDQKAVSTIIAEGLPTGGAGTAYMNRLRKAAGGGEVPQ